MLLLPVTYMPQNNKGLQSPKLLNGQGDGNEDYPSFPNWTLTQPAALQTQESVTKHTDPRARRSGAEF